MNELMNLLSSCDVHFVRCIKPNEQKRSDVFDSGSVLNQIRYLGVLETLKVRKESYPLRKKYENFYK
jgi:myosin heavy subunit